MNDTEVRALITYLRAEGGTDAMIRERLAEIGCPDFPLTDSMNGSTL